MKSPSPLQFFIFATTALIAFYACNVQAATIITADVVLRERVLFQTSRQFVVSANFNGIEGMMTPPKTALAEGWEETFSNWEEIEYGLFGQWGLFSAQGAFDFRLIPFDYSEINIPFPELSTNDRVLLAPPNIVTVTNGTIVGIKNLTPAEVKWRDIGGGKYSLRPMGNSSIHTIEVTARSAPQDLSVYFTSPLDSWGNATFELRMRLIVYREVDGRITFAVPEPYGHALMAAGFLGAIFVIRKQPSHRLLHTRLGGG